MPEIHFMPVTPTRIIVIGTSAGGMQALGKLVSKLPNDFPAAIFIVQHLSIDSSADFLVKRLNRYTELTCKVAQHEATIEPGTLYMAPADRHLLLTGKKMLVVRGPRENQFRPGIDPLFRSAAAYHGNSVVGVILTGFMSDGVVGIENIQRCGGTTVVQDPEDAEFPVLPNNVIRQVAINYVVPADQMGELLTKLVKEPVVESITVPTDIYQEAMIAERVMTNSAMTNIKDLDDLGERSQYSCPECGGGIWEIAQPGTVKRYRCYTGHAYTQDMLLMGMNNNLEETLWVALRTLEERRSILVNMSQTEVAKGNSRWGSIQEDRAQEMKVHIERLRELLSQSSREDKNHIGQTG
jgi:two-component system, chemotaxis family, protein-glutamate methylesterase/glutaminase